MFLILSEGQHHMSKVTDVEVSAFSECFLLLILFSNKNRNLYAISYFLILHFSELLCRWLFSVVIYYVNQLYVTNCIRKFTIVRCEGKCRVSLCNDCRLRCDGTTPETGVIRRPGVSQIMPNKHKYQYF